MKTNYEHPVKAKFEGKITSDDASNDQTALSSRKFKLQDISTKTHDVQLCSYDWNSRNHDVQLLF